MTRKAIAAVLGGLVWTSVAIAAQAPAADPAKAAAGKLVYDETKCSKCHGDAGVGDKNGKQVLVGIYPKTSAADIRKWITSPAEMTAKLPKKPKEPMKKFDLTDKQVDDLVNYVMSLKK
jgi:mono/diheme cytochrome c family protein